MGDSDKSDALSAARARLQQAQDQAHSLLDEITKGLAVIDNDPKARKLEAVAEELSAKRRRMSGALQQACERVKHAATVVGGR